MFRSGAPVLRLPQEAKEGEELVVLCAPIFLSLNVVAARWYSHVVLLSDYRIRKWRATHVSILPTCW